LKHNHFTVVLLPESIFFRILGGAITAGVVASDFLIFTCLCGFGCFPTAAELFFPDFSCCLFKLAVSPLSFNPSNFFFFFLFSPLFLMKFFSQILTNFFQKNSILSFLCLHLTQKKIAWISLNLLLSKVH